MSIRPRSRGLPVNRHALRALRAQARMTQTELATRAGIRQGHLSKLESGQRPNPVVATTLALAGALGVPLSAILTASPEEIAAAVQNV